VRAKLALARADDHFCLKSAQLQLSFFTPFAVNKNNSNAHAQSIPINTMPFFANF
jgi:hypothetical protein